MTLTQQLRDSGWLPISAFGIAAEGQAGGSSGQQALIQQALYDIASDVGSGELRIPNGQMVKVTSSIGLPSGCGISGASFRADNFNAQPPYNGRSGLRLERGAHIEVGDSGFLKGLVVLPPEINGRQSAAAVGTWGGTSVVLKASTSGQRISECFFGGYDRAVTREQIGQVGITRFEMDRCLIDCWNGINIEYDYDVPMIDKVRCYPILSYGGEPQDLLRPGTAFRAGAVCDWGWFQDCFNYGYMVGFDIDGARNFSVINCGADYVPQLRGANSVGFRVNAASGYTTLKNCKAAGRAHGVVINGNNASDVSTLVGDMQAWSCTNGVTVGSGKALIDNPRIYDGAPNAVGVRCLGGQTSVIGGRINVQTAFYRHASAGLVIDPTVQFGTSVTTNIAG